MNHYLPRKVPSYLQRLGAEYEVAYDGEDPLNVVTKSRVFVVPETEYNEFNGGIHGHDVRLYMPLSVHRTVPINKLEALAQRLRDDLNTLARNIPNEYIRAVLLELDDEDDPDFQEAIGFSGRPIVNPDTLDFWRPGLVRIFISHRDGHKAKAHRLAEAMIAFGISSFVAHEQIAPMKEWRKEIMNGLQTMEVMVLFLTDDFQDSAWTNQEVGFALGKNIPIISLKLETRDPPGFVSHEQALRGSLDDPAKSASQLFRMIADVVGAEDRLTDALIASFVVSDNFYETKDRFERMKAVVRKLSFRQVMTIVDGFSKNDQLYNAGHLTSHYNRLTNWLHAMTGNDFKIDGKALTLVIPKAPTPLDDDIPF